MSTDYAALAKEVDSGVAALVRGAPGPMRGYVQMVQAVVKDGALDAKTKELMATAIAVATHCEPCIAYHVRGAIKHGASREETLEAIAVAVEMGGGPAAVYGGKALAAFDQLSEG